MLDRFLFAIGIKKKSNTSPFDAEGMSDDLINLISIRLDNKSKAMLAQVNKRMHKIVENTPSDTEDLFPKKVAKETYTQIRQLLNAHYKNSGDVQIEINEITNLYDESENKNNAYCTPGEICVISTATGCLPGLPLGGAISGGLGTAMGLLAILATMITTCLGLSGYNLFSYVKNKITQNNNQDNESHPSHQNRLA